MLTRTILGAAMLAALPRLAASAADDKTGRYRAQIK